MKIQWLLPAIAALAVGCSPTDSASTDAGANAATAMATSNDIPRTPAGKPDFNGSGRCL